MTGEFVKMGYSVNVILIMRYSLELYLLGKTHAVNVSRHGENPLAPPRLEVTEPF